MTRNSTQVKVLIAKLTDTDTHEIEDSHPEVQALVGKTKVAPHLCSRSA